MTCWTSLAAATAFSSSAMTMLALYIFLDFEFLSNACCDFLKREIDLYAQIGSTILRFLSLSASTEAFKSAKASTMSAKYITEHREDVIHREAATSAEASKTATTTRSVKAELVILLTLVRIMQYIISLSSLLEFLLSLFVAGILVRVILYGYFAVSLLYLVVCGSLANAKYFVIVSFCHCINIEDCLLLTVQQLPWRVVSLYR